MQFKLKLEVKVTEDVVKQIFKESINRASKHWLKVKVDSENGKTKGEVVYNLVNSNLPVYVYDGEDCPCNKGDEVIATITKQGIEEGLRKYQLAHPKELMLILSDVGVLEGEVYDKAMQFILFGELVYG